MSLTTFQESTTFASENNGASKVTYTEVLNVITPRLSIALPITARTADCNITAQLQHAPTEDGPWIDYGAAAQITDTTDALALLTGTASAAVSGPILPFVRVKFTVVDRTGPNNLVSFTCAPYAVWENYTAQEASMSLQRPALNATYESGAGGGAVVTYVNVPNLFDGSVLRCVMDITTREANSDVIVTLEQAITSSGPWESVGTLITDTSDATGGFTGYLSEASIGQLLPYLRLGVSVADGGGAVQRTIVATLWVETDGISMPEGSTAPASTGISNGNTTAVNQATTPTNQATTATNQNTTATNQNTTATNQATTATNQNATATNNATELSGTQDLGTPAAVNDTGVHAAYLPSDPNNFPGPFTNPDVPRSIRVKFGAGWDGGDITVSGTDQFDNAVDETFVSNPGATSGGSKTFKTVTAAVKTLVGVGVAGASIGFSNRIGIGSAALPKIANHNGYGVGSLTVDGVSEAAEYNGTYSSVKPTTAPDGAKRYIALFNASQTIVQAAHNHVQDAHNHTQDAHGHVQDAHGHTQDAHNHTQDAHNHTQNAHTHAVTDPQHAHAN